jgi:hypothetical protein
VVWHPHDHAARGPHRLGHAVDVRHDRPRQRHFKRKPLGHEVVLHVDNDQRGAAGLDGVVAQELALAANDALLDRVGYDVAMHGSCSAR